MPGPSGPASLPPLHSAYYAGADDSVPGPPSQFSKRQREKEATLADSGQVQTTLTIGSTLINLQTREVRGSDGKALHTTYAQFELIKMLLEAKGNVVSRDTLSKCILRRPYNVQGQSLHVLVCRVRQLLASDPTMRRVIHTVRGWGYKMALPDESQAQR